MLTVKEVANSLINASEIKVLWDDQAVGYTPGNGLMEDALGGYIVKRIYAFQTVEGKCGFELGVACKPTRADE